jgi:hypothetical protein
MTSHWLQSKELFNLKYAGHCKLTVDDDNNDVMVFEKTKHSIPLIQLFLLIYAHNLPLNELITLFNGSPNTVLPND